MFPSKQKAGKIFVCLNSFLWTFDFKELDGQFITSIESEWGGRGSGGVGGSLTNTEIEGHLEALTDPSAEVVSRVNAAGAAGSDR